MFSGYTMVILVVIQKVFSLRLGLEAINEKFQTRLGVLYLELGAKATKS